MKTLNPKPHMITLNPKPHMLNPKPIPDQVTLRVVGQKPGREDRGARVRVDEPLKDEIRV